MASPEHVAMLKQGAQAWNEWLRTTGIEPDLIGADLCDMELTGINLTRAKLTRADLARAILRDADLNFADLSDAFVDGADLTGANLNVANVTHADLSNATLTGARLHGAALCYANLRKTNFTGADLSHADLTDARLIDANLTNANLAHANLDNARVTRVTLIRAQLTHAHLWGAKLTEAILTEADLSGARLLETVFSDIDLSRTIGLASCQHAGPSVIDTRTLLKSASLPLPFLRGCGLPERLIDYLPSLLNAGAIQFYSCFISYSTVNQDFADRLHADLQSNGVRCWFAPHDMQAGKKIHEQIDEAIRVYDRLLLILSHESMASEWVATEIAKARGKEATLKRRVLFPISIVPFDAIRSWELFDADRGKDSAREVREYFIPDFTDWKHHDTYTKAFDKLLKALKAADAQPRASV